MTTRPRRSVLYMPGSNQRALEKARTLPADSLVLDLEDSVGPEKKVAARDQVMAAVSAGGYGYREIIIRANSLDSEWGEDDIRAIALSGADGLCLPKVENQAQVEAAINLLNDAGAPASMQVWVMIETPLGVTNIQQIASASARITVIAMGTTDLSKELRVTDRIGLLYSLSQCVLAARAYNKEILDGVYLDLHNDQGFTDTCVQGKHLGFDGKTLIHPKQLAAANQVFGPSANDIERAENMIAAWKLAEAEGKGVVVVDGKLVEAMHIDEARRHLARAEKIAAQQTK
ncbi:CoA ester lyase [uncultured Oceanicoccus sp.]|uniref:HpcH/HpaI aldolase/citrate lyase family protein n=1 Tax=uncultured Oceanicoccus sp. TaxID=1706381 RepID=UPI0030DBD847